MSNYAVAIAEEGFNEIFVVSAENGFGAMKEAVIQSYKEEGNEVLQQIYLDLEELETVEDLQEYMTAGGYFISEAVILD